jgi:hypothetical protein
MRVLVLAIVSSLETRFVDDHELKFRLITNDVAIATAGFPGGNRRDRVSIRRHMMEHQPLAAALSANRLSAVSQIDFCPLEQWYGTAVRIMSSRTQLVPSVIILGSVPRAINHSYTGAQSALICLPPLSSFPEQTPTRVTFDSSDSLLPEPEPRPHAARRRPTEAKVFRAHFRVSTSGAPKLRSARCPQP